MGSNEGAIILLMLLLVAGVIVVVFYLKNLQDLMREVSPHNRQVEPGNVWLMFIPLFNIIYGFILYPKICDSVKREMEERGIGEAGDYGRGIGITMPILNCCGWIPVLGGIAGLTNLILLIIFWSKMAGYKNRLRMTPISQGSNISSNTDLLD